MTRDTYPKQFAKRRDNELPEHYRWLPELYRSTSARLEKLEREADKQFPGWYDRMEQVRQMQQDQWPGWCWMPITEVTTVIAEHYAGHISPPPGALGDVLSPESLIAMGAGGDAARLAALGAWRHAGRHIINFHDSMTPDFERWPDRLPADLPERWPLLGYYMTFEASTGSAGQFVHLEWDAKERRIELRLMMDMHPVARLDHLMAQPLYLEGTSLTDALAQTWAAAGMRTYAMQGRDDILDVSPGSSFDQLIRSQAVHIRVWAAAADAAASTDVAKQDAAEILERTPAGETWPPKPTEARHPMFWLAAPQALVDRS
ncbi:hypothetical protein ACQP2T_61870 [Nonomuraea sp. CA-143628]|uniref:hypothetical protein n=1 Tax=Nonomuraea sp. CA-143628 TaxID=3239997 RepID=UPI003D8C4737